MSQDLVLTPAGHLQFRENNENDGNVPDSWKKGVAVAFSVSQAAGLFALAATRPGHPPSPAISFWRDFACRYLTDLCRTPESTTSPLLPIEPPGEADLSAWLLAMPPMSGGEYLNFEVLRALWSDLDGWAHREIAAAGEGFAGWLKEHAPDWRPVGRICLHLAENRGDNEFPFAFLATYAPRLSRGGRVQYQPLGGALREYAGEGNRKTLITLLSPIHRASERVDFIRELVDSGEIFHPLAWTSEEAYRLLRSVPQLEDSGLLVRLPDWWQKRSRPRVAVSIGEKRKGGIGIDALLDFKIGLVLGDRDLDEGELEEILASGGNLVNLRGKWIEVDREKLSEALAHWRRVAAGAAGRGISFNEGMRLLAGAPAGLDPDDATAGADREWSFITPGRWLSDVLATLRNPGRLKSGVSDGSFRGTLRPYQEIGRDWLGFLSRLGLGACLADDMGLGKTVQVLSFLLNLKESGASGKASLLVLPASLLANWKVEIERFTPTLRAIFVHPSETDGTTLAELADNPAEALQQTDVVLTSYGMLLRHKWLLETDWRLVILDEAQTIKNPSTRQTRAVKQLQAEARIALTGTPVENRLADLWSLFDFLCPGLLGSAAKFKRFVKAIESQGTDRYAPLRNLVRPYILRRLKTDRSIITDLPDKIGVKVFCGLTKKQASLYAQTVERLASSLKGLDGIKRRGLVLAYLLRFKQICNHPSQFLGDGGYDPDDSGKFDRLGALGEEIASRQEKVLVFTQYREMTEPIATFLGGVFGREGLVLHGGTPVKNRRSCIDRFQMEEGPPFFVLSLKAGGTGLNLTAASHVIHFDRWWNPAVENQATDRAFRIGQHRNVVVHQFVSRGTIEEKIDSLIEEKSKLADSILTAGAESLLTEMSDRELLETVALDLDRARF
jgi:SNF2 family DNA or RNA helicase